MSPHVRKRNDYQEHEVPEDLIGENGLRKQLTKQLVKKALEGELTEHLGHDRCQTLVNYQRQHLQRQELEEPQGRVLRTAH